MSGGALRAAAAQLLADVSAGQSLARVLPPALEEQPADTRPLFQELVYATLREWPRLEGLARQLLQKPLRSKDGDVHALVMLGLQQLSGSRIAEHAAVSETVAAARALGKPWAAGLINGVLRNYQRRSEALEAALDDAASAALPQWLFDALEQEYPEHHAQIADASRSRPPLTLRVNGCRTQRDAYQRLLEAAGFSSTPIPDVADALTVTPAVDVGHLPHFADGWASVQDASAQLAAELLDLAAGQRVLDACAAPGGKACHLLERYPQLGELVAADISATRLERVTENANRLGLALTTLTLDATQASHTLPPQGFDAIVLDAPCSATGVIRRNPDVKLHRCADDVVQFARQQCAIVAGVWPLLKPGGALLYITCSVLDAENADVVETMLSRLDDAQLDVIQHPRALPRRIGIQTLPDVGAGDGLYFARLRKCA